VFLATWPAADGWRVRHLGPKTTEVVEQAGGKAPLLTTNRNLLIVADLLVVNRGFAQANPKTGRRPRRRPARGQPDGPRQPRRPPRRHRQGVQVGPQRGAGGAGEGAPLEPAGELAFFRGDIDAAGSFGGIYQSAVYAYGAS
jgi:NitT/TauT family transport system substrate-binding protein